MNIRPAGYFVLIKVDEVEETTSGGIILMESTLEKEKMIVETGTIEAFGPTAFIGMRGCTEEDVARTGLPAYELWGLRHGDKVEFKKYEGKKSALPGMESYRYVHDTNIIGVIDNG